MVGDREGAGGGREPVHRLWCWLASVHSVSLAGTILLSNPLALLKYLIHWEFLLSDFMYSFCDDC